MKCIPTIHGHLPVPFSATSCTHVNGSRIETVKYLINKDLFVYSKPYSTCWYTTFDLLNHFLRLVGALQ